MIRMNKIIKSHCNTCQGETKQEVLHSEEIRIRDDDDYGIWVDNIYEMLKCRGCGSITLKQTQWDSENYDNIPDFYYYPPSTSRPEPKWISDLNRRNDEQNYIRDLIKEIYSSLHNHNHRLATMGIRALIEHTMIKKIGDNGSFLNNLNVFMENGFISKNQKDRLNTVLEAGHATIHRSYSPATEDIHTCIDITESVVESVYIHPEKANKLEKRIPKKRNANGWLSGLHSTGNVKIWELNKKTL